jgi:hypothetical protein
VNEEQLTALVAYVKSLSKSSGAAGGATAAPSGAQTQEPKVQ